MNLVSSFKSWLDGYRSSYRGLAVSNAHPSVAARRLMIEFSKNPASVYDRVLAYVNGSLEMKEISPELWESTCGFIRVENDIYGYEVTIHPNPQFLDCNPRSYGLTRQQATELYKAILRKIPTSIYYKHPSLREA